jgi:hypothetical protein
MHDRLIVSAVARAVEDLSADGVIRKKQAAGLSL